MASTFIFSPLLPPHDQSNMMALIVLSDETKTRIQAIRQNLMLHDAISTSIEFIGVFIQADEPVTPSTDNPIEEIIAWFSEHNLPISSGVLTVLPNGISISGIALGFEDAEALSTGVIPFVYLEKDDAVVSLINDKRLPPSAIESSPLLQ